MLVCLVLFGAGAGVFCTDQHHYLIESDVVHKLTIHDELKNGPHKLSLTVHHQGGATREFIVILRSVLQEVMAHGQRSAFYQLGCNR